MTTSTNNICFSVVTIVYNGEGYIEETLKSTINQTYPNIEYIVVDGASSDRTLDIISKYSHRITKLISEPDKGLYDAMNKGLDNCTGDYVIFMNGGDRFYDSDVLLKIHKAISNDNDKEFIYGDAFVEGNNINGLLYKKARSHKYAWYGMFTNHQAMIYKLSVIRENNIRHDISYKIAADYKFTLAFLKYCKEVKYIDMPFCIFSLGGVSLVQRDIGLNEAEKARREIRNYGPLRQVSIRTLIYSSRLISDYLGGVYKRLRYSKTKR